ncbi:MAG: methylated-DNA--[protein]-cysteine S-methyltransferase [Patescibacteria group bacterium]
MNIYYYNLPTVSLKILAENNKLVGIQFKREYWQNRQVNKTDNIFSQQLEEYFKGRRTEFDLPISFKTGTAWQKKVWRALTKIPYGQTISYGDLAAQLGDRKKARAVAAACSANPIPIVIPCHRVIAADGTLGGYAGGVSIKEWLLDQENI